MAVSNKYKLAAALSLTVAGSALYIFWRSEDIFSAESGLIWFVFLIFFLSFALAFSLGIVMIDEAYPRKEKDDEIKEELKAINDKLEKLQKHSKGK